MGAVLYWSYIWVNIVYNVLLLQAIFQFIPLLHSECAKFCLYWLKYRVTAFSCSNFLLHFSSKPTPWWIIIRAFLRNATFSNTIDLTSWFIFPTAVALFLNTFKIWKCITTIAFPLNRGCYGKNWDFRDVVMIKSKKNQLNKLSR